MKRPLLPPTLVLTALLCGCPAAPGPDGSDVRQLGVVSLGALYGEAGDYEVYGASGFFLPVDRTLESLVTVRDRCFVYDPPPLLPDEAYAALLDAGEVIDIRTDGRPFAPLARINFAGGGYGYTAGEFGTYPPVPESGLVVVVPGAAFPALSGEFPSPPPPVVLTGAGESVPLTADGSFTWEPHEVEGGASLIAFQVAPPDTETRPYVVVNCVAADDGVFTFPEETREEVRALAPDFEGVVLRPDRSAYRLEARGDAALALGLGNPSDVIRVLLSP